MYDMQLHSVKIDSEITQTEFPMKSYNYDGKQFNKGAAERIKYVERVTTGGKSTNVSHEPSQGQQCSRLGCGG